MVPHHEIACLERPTLEKFIEISSCRTKPILIRGAMAEWAALKRWSQDYFVEQFGTRVLRVLAIPEGARDGFFLADEKKGFQVADLDLRTYLSSIAGGGPPKYYLAALPLRRVFPELMDDIAIPHYAPNPQVISPALWFGGAGATSPLHFDASENFHAVIAGDKRFLMYDRSQSALLYQKPMLSSAPHMSEVDPENPDLEKYPRFRHAQAAEVVLEPGDMLFIPAGHWHQVSNIKTSIALTFPWREKHYGTQFFRLVPSRLVARVRRLQRLFSHRFNRVAAR